MVSAEQDLKKMKRQKRRALLIGVSEYDRNPSLPFCQNDADHFANTLKNSLFFSEDEISVLSGEVKYGSFQSAFDEFKGDDLDLGILFFSGHGGGTGRFHTLQFSDRADATSIIIEEAAKRTESLIVVLDCCYAGNAEPEPSAKPVLDAPYGSGSIVFASSGPDEPSYQIDNRELRAFGLKDLSAFTFYICAALEMGYVQSKGFVELDIVERSLRLMMSNFNTRHHDGIHQHVVVRRNMHGSVFVENPDFVSYKQATFPPLDGEGYKVVAVRPLHVASLVRYSVQVLLQENADISFVESISGLIVAYAKTLSIFNNANSESYHFGRPVTHVFAYFYPSDADIRHSNARWRLTWVDPFSNRDAFYGGSGFLFNDCWLAEMASYEAIHRLLLENSIDSDYAKMLIESTINEADLIARGLFLQFDELQNGIINENEFISFVHEIACSIDDLMRRSSDFGFADGCHKKQLSLLVGLVGCLHDCKLFYTAKVFLARDGDNRKRCFFDARRRYDNDFRRLKELMDA